MPGIARIINPISVPAANGLGRRAKCLIQDIRTATYTATASTVQGLSCYQNQMNLLVQPVMANSQALSAFWIITRLVRTAIYYTAESANLASKMRTMSMAIFLSAYSANPNANVGNGIGQQRT
jgi:hypothetical protein